MWAGLKGRVLLDLPRRDTKCIVAKLFGGATFKELFAALKAVGEPCKFPYVDWPGVTVSVIA